MLGRAKKKNPHATDVLHNNPVLSNHMEIFKRAQMHPNTDKHVQLNSMNKYKYVFVFVHAVIIIQIHICICIWDKINRFSNNHLFCYPLFSFIIQLSII